MSTYMRLPVEGDVNADKSSRINCQVFNTIFRKANDPNQTAKTTQEFLKVTKYIFLYPSQSSDLKPAQHAFPRIQLKLKVCTSHIVHNDIVYI